ncbi:Ubiquitin-like-specific protease 1 [Bienertia sinuspersici]
MKVDDSKLEILISEIEKSIENFCTDEETKKPVEEVEESNDREEVVSSKMDSVSVVKEEQHIPYINEGDSFAAKSEDSTIRQPKSSEINETYTALPVTNCDIILLRTLQQQRNDYLDELTLEEQERKKSHEIPEDFGSTYFLLPFAKDNPKYDTTEAEWLKEKEKMTVRGRSFYVDKCRQSMNSWEKLFPNNNIRNVDLIFVPTYLDNHFTVLVFNVDKKLIEDIDNRSDNKHFKRYGEELYDRVFELCCVLQRFSQGNRINRRGFNGLHHWKRKFISFPLRSNQNIHDCGIYSVKAMECYDGENEKMEPISTLSILAIDLVTYRENKNKQQVMKDCVVWSRMKPSLFQRQKIRKDKERHLLTLRAKRVKQAFEEDQKIGKERARHEKEFDDFLNDNYYYSAKLEAFLQYDYNQETKPQ